MIEEVEHLEGLTNLAKTLKPIAFPTRFAVEICADCNLNCLMCHHDKMKRPKGRMPIELWQKCADQIAELSPETHCWFSFCGEPLLEPDLLIQMIKYGKSVGLQHLNINTNGTLLTPELTERLMISGADLIVFGIDGFTRETYEKVRIGGNRDQLYSYVEYFLKRRQAHNSGPEVQVQFIEMEVNQHEFKAFRSHWLDRGATVKFRKMLSWGGKFQTPLEVPFEKRIPCPWAITMMHVFWDGRVPRCPGDTEGEEGVGNAWEESLKTLWQKLDVFRELHLNEQFEKLPLRCHSCRDWMVGAAERIRSNL